MKKDLRGFFLTVALGIGCLHVSSWASDGPAKVHSASIQDQERAIQQVMKAQFDKPNDPLVVKPISIEGSFALAGWLQGANGGRALLQYEHGHWTISVCAGDALLQESTLSQTGMTAHQARELVKNAKMKESKLDTATRHQLSSFQGLLNVKQQGSHAHQHGAHAQPGH